MDPFNERAGLYRPRVARGCRGAIPDELFDGCSPARLASGPGAGRVLGLDRGAGRGAAGGALGDVDPGQQLITVIRKGTRALQQVPASPDAFVWLRLYQCGLAGRCRPGVTTCCGGPGAARFGR